MTPADGGVDVKTQTQVCGADAVVELVFFLLILNPSRYATDLDERASVVQRRQEIKETRNESEFTLTSYTATVLIIR